MSYSYSQVYVSGHITNAPEDAHFKIEFYNNHFEYTILTTVNERLDENGRFSAEFEWDKSGEAQLNVADEYCTIYLSPGDSLFITCDYALFDSTLHFKGKGMEVNNFMAAQSRSFYFKRAYRYAPNEDPYRYLAYVDSIQNENIALLNSFDSTQFSDDFKLYIHNGLKYRFVDARWMFQVDFNNRDENGKPTYKDLPADYFNFIWEIDLDDQAAYDNVYYSNALERYLFEAIRKLDNEADSTVKKESFYEKEFRLINSMFRGEVLDFQLTKAMYHYVVRVLQDGGGIPFISDYRKTCKTPEYVDIIDLALQRRMNLAKGSSAPNFTLENEKGERVSLASLKDKVVFIDFWATWCSPCTSTLYKTEALAEKFKTNENVAILLINVGDDKERWKKYIENEKIKGMHLFANGEESKKLFKDYNFNGIPHYVLIGKNGEMINANAKNIYPLERLIDLNTKQ